MSQWAVGPQTVESNSSCGRFWLECVLAKWFERARDVRQDDATLKKLTACVARARELLPPVLWLSVFYTITLHLGCTVVAKEVQAITMMLLVELPDQAIWHLVGRRHLPAVKQAIAAEQLVAKKDFVDTWSDIVSIASQLEAMVNSTGVVLDNITISYKILVPTSSQLIDLSGANPVYIKRIWVGRPIAQYKSKPRIVGLVGSDNNTYRFVLKKDAIRKDEFVMQSATLVNRLLAANKPTIDIRLETYAVVPLANDVALIEWVPNTITLFAAVEKEARETISRCMRNYKVELDALAGGDICSSTAFTELMSKEPEKVCKLYKEYASDPCFKEHLVKWYHDVWF
ncbi:hypothetical protein SDRG_02391 [Saprolegnia diclina VS20]|uniref:PI3K/PI4K catalytic domain-containing protein n=1 Tax=Saprolegnia diclina (strain VS20) TaxID=1156394 RepID=T0R2I7_SAPDV|nr:hypothetical protein SDRG_02391 [Saprolegnia diclina VS20]EQC40500.1 hypothetical protein SDRG_02391 [Saprolegnia diclina VS20]|eukprot:XP_008606199.1 hypothetical protein SDRG_02391 [Saprolegnia diclina VS20]